jgi:hypothetical protein
VWRPWGGRSPGRPGRSLRSSRRETAELRQRGNRPVGQVARDFDLTRPRCGSGSKQGERDAYQQPGPANVTHAVTSFIRPACQQASPTGHVSAADREVSGLGHRQASGPAPAAAHPHAR